MVPSPETADDPLDSTSEVGLVASDTLLFGRFRITVDKKYVTLSLLVVVNLLNYMDRFTIAGIPDDVRSFYTITDSELGQLQTVFVVFYTALSPLSGYYGDRWKRKYIMLMGLVIWISVTFASSFVPSNMFYLFLLTRCLVGVGEASYSTLAPTILSDLFVGNERTSALGAFYFAVPVGSGLGFILGSTITRVVGNWQWALRVTPVLGVICLILFSLFHVDPPRGYAEGGSHIAATSWTLDMKSILTNKAFMYISGGYTCVCFTLGCLTWFGIDFIQLALKAKYDDPNIWKKYNVPIVFGISTCFAGIFGVLSGTTITRVLRRRYASADALVCAGSLFIGAPFLYFALISPTLNFFVCVLLVFVVQFLLCITWAIVSDMTMGVVIPTRRSTASAVQMIITHALGDAISPAIIGKIAVLITDSSSLEGQYLGLQRALFINPYVCTLGAYLFLRVNMYLVEAKANVQNMVEESKRNDHSEIVAASEPL